MSDASPRFRRMGVITARRLDRRMEWTTDSGDVLVGQPGDWLVESTEGSVRTVAEEQFRMTHEHISGDLWRRTGEVTAAQVREPCDVTTREGVARAHAGDWVLTSDDGWSWPVPDPVFRASYEPVDPGRGCSPARSSAAT